jgi:hypothetical protein
MGPRKMSFGAAAGGTGGSAGTIATLAVAMGHSLAIVLQTSQFPTYFLPISYCLFFSRLCYTKSLILVEVSGIEPLTSCMPCKRSPS